MRLVVSFADEEGIDASGLTRSGLDREIFNPNYCLFTSAADGASFQPNPYSAISTNHLDWQSIWEGCGGWVSFLIIFVVYHVTENGWVQVWSGDTTPMYYEYYPLKVQKRITSEESGGGDEEMKVVS